MRTYLRSRSLDRRSLRWYLYYIHVIVKIMLEIFITKYRVTDLDQFDSLDRSNLCTNRDWNGDCKFCLDCAILVTYCADVDVPDFYPYTHILFNIYSILSFLHKNILYLDRDLDHDRLRLRLLPYSRRPRCRRPGDSGLRLPIIVQISH